MQEVAWQASLVLMGALLLVFLFVVAHSRVREADYTPIQKKAYRMRVRLFWGLMLTLGPAALLTLVDLPYDKALATTQGKPQVVEAVAYQWRWELSRDRLVAGQPVEFRVRTGDVNHGFGIYDTELRLVAQVQAMPGYTNRLRHTFTQPGTYKVLCMEYCGVAHHNMTADITVTER